MAWTQLHQSLPSHKKTYKLALILGIDRLQAIGHVVCLWCWSLDNAEDGSLHDCTDTLIAEVCLWKGDPGEFVAALIESQFMDDERTLHKWFEYAGKLIEARKKNAQRMKDARAISVQCTCGAQTTNINGTCDACAGARKKERKKERNTPPNPLPGEPAVKKSSRKRYEYSEAFLEIWATYPRPVDKAQAYRAYNGLCHRVTEEGGDLSIISQSVNQYALYCREKGTPEDRIKHPSTFFNQDLEDIRRQAAWRSDTGNAATTPASHDPDAELLASDPQTYWRRKNMSPEEIAVIEAAGGRV